MDISESLALNNFAKLLCIAVSKSRAFLVRIFQRLLVKHTWLTNEPSSAALTRMADLYYPHRCYVASTYVFSNNISN